MKNGFVQSVKRRSTNRLSSRLSIVAMQYSALYDICCIRACIC
jgi:hypothetical protein